MKRRDFMTFTAGVLSLAGVSWANETGVKIGGAGAGGGITEKQILKDGEPATIANYCSDPQKSAKACPSWKDRPGHCETCNFFNKDNSLTTFKGTKYARCQLLADPSKPQFVSVKGYCSTYVQKT